MLLSKNAAKLVCKTLLHDFSNKNSQKGVFDQRMKSISGYLRLEPALLQLQTADRGIQQKRTAHKEKAVSGEYIHDFSTK